MKFYYYIYFAIKRFTFLVRSGPGFGEWRAHTLFLFILMFPAASILYEIKDWLDLSLEGWPFGIVAVAPLFLINEYLFSRTKIVRSYESEFAQFSDRRRLTWDAMVIVTVILSVSSLFAFKLFE